MVLWTEECMTTIYVQNNNPHQILKNITPEEAFTKEKPEIGHFRIFGYLVYFHVPKEKRFKLDPLVRKGTFVRYNESLKEYQIYIPGERQIEVRRDVIFEEHIAFQKSIESHIEIDNEIVPSPPLVVQRETTIIPVNPIVPVDLAAPVDPAAPVDVPRDIALGHKRPSWAQQTLQEEEGHATPQGTFEKARNQRNFRAIF
jgi:hypothetical protein